MHFIPTRFDVRATGTPDFMMALKVHLNKSQHFACTPLHF